MKANCVNVTQFTHVEPMYVFEWSKFNEFLNYTFFSVYI